MVMDPINAALSITQQPVGGGDTGGKGQAQERGIDFPGGLINASVHGRTDKIPLNIPSGSYVLPADIVSALGQGNTMAGAKAVQHALADAPYGASGGPYGTGAAALTHGSGVGNPGGPPPYPEPLKPGEAAKRASGGRTAAKALTGAAGVLIAAPGPKPMVLFLRRSMAGDHGGEWAFPGGHIEPGESPMIAAQREMHEEIGVVLPRLIPMTKRIIGGVEFFTFLAPAHATFRPRLNNEHLEARWAPLDAPPQPLHPGVNEVLARARVALGLPAKHMMERGAKLVPIIAAGGELVLTPHECRYVGDGDIDKGHARLDKFVVETRRNLRETLSKLEAPRKD